MQMYTWPPILAITSSPSVGPNGLAIPVQSTLVGGKDPGGLLKPLSVDAGGVLNVAAASLPLPAGAATSALQTAGNASLASIDSKLANPMPVLGPLTDTQLRATAVPVSAAFLPLPVGAATETTLSAINTKLANPMPVSGPLTDTQLRATAVPVSGPLTDTQLRATAVPVSAAALPLPTGAATEATLAALNTKSPGSLVPVAFDYIALTYVGVTTNINTASYKTGGAGGTLVATLTMGYDGSNRLTSVTKT